MSATPFSDDAERIARTLLTRVGARESASRPALRAAGDRLVIGIDGRSGSGKTTLATTTARYVERELGWKVSVLELEMFIEGWDGLLAGSERVAEAILQPFRRGSEVRAQLWDWHAGAWGSQIAIEAAPHSQSSHHLLILCGCGSTSAACAPLLDLSVWVEAPAELRRRRVAQREGDPKSWWDAWALQEEALLASHPSDEQADIVISSASTHSEETSPQ